MKYIEDIQMFLLNMAFISSSEVENIYIPWVAKPRMKYTYFLLHEWNKSHIQQKIIEIFFLLYTTMSAKRYTSTLHFFQAIPISVFVPWQWT